MLAEPVAVDGPLGSQAGLLALLGGQRLAAAELVHGLELLGVRERQDPGLDGDLGRGVALLRLAAGAGLLELLVGDFPRLTPLALESLIFTALGLAALDPILAR